jgi:hypothetical protein
VRLTSVAAILFVCALSLIGAAPAFAQCALKREPMANMPRCMGFVGYSNGARVGAFHLPGNVYVSAGGVCPNNWPRGVRVAADRIRVGGRVYTLTADCRNAY